MGTMKYTYISGVNTNMSDYANGTNANANNANVSGTNTDVSDVATKSSTRKFVTLSTAWQPCGSEFLGRHDQESSIGKYIFI